MGRRSHAIHATVEGWRRLSTLLGSVLIFGETLLPHNSGSSASFSDVLFDLNPTPMWVYDVETLRFLKVNDASIAAYGYSREQFLAMTILEIRPPEDRDDVAAWAAARDTSQAFRSTGSWKHRRSDGLLIDVDVANSSRISYEGRAAVLAMSFDVTEQNDRINQLEAHRAALQQAQEAGNLGGFMMDVEQGTFQLAGLLVGVYGRKEMPLSEAAAEIARVWHPSDASEGERLMRSFERFESYDGEFRMALDGEMRWFHGRTSVVRDPDGKPTGIVGFAVDVTDRKAEADRLYALAFTDAATGLPNRASLFEHVERSGFTFAALVLMRVTWVAEASHRSQQARMRTASAIAAKLQRLAPEDALVFRYSENTFAILTKRTERVRVPTALAKRIIVAFERPVSEGCDAEYVVIPTIGVAVAEGSGCSIEKVALRAEAALHEAQRSPDRVAFYTAELEKVHDRRATIERNLRHAITQRRVGVVFQPILSLKTGRIAGAEALMRWDCPGIGPVPPSEFIAIAEESGVILRLGEWILHAACLEARSWQLRGFGRLRIAINVSPRQVEQREFVRLVLSACEDVGLDPCDVELEITERVMMDRDGPAVRNLEALRRRGVRVSVDDFGTGYSALSYLESVPLDAVKLDRAFVAAVGEGAFQGEIAASVIRLAHARGLTVVGEGIETESQVAWLRANGCDEGQGFLFARPIEGDDFQALVRRSQSDIFAVLAAATPELQTA